MNANIHTAFKKHNIHYFSSYSNVSNPNSILRYIIEHPEHGNTIAIAFIIKINFKTNKPVWQYALFKDWVHFEQVLYDIADKYRTFYNIFSSAHRCLYMDIDFETNDTSLLNISTSIGTNITDTIISSVHKLKTNGQMKGVLDIQCTTTNIEDSILSFDSSRYISPTKIKLSYHILLPIMSYQSLEYLKYDINLIKKHIHSSMHHIFKNVDIIDMSVYIGSHYQLLRMPGNIKINEPCSIKRIIKACVEFSMISQIILNQCGAPSLPHISTNKTIYNYHNKLLSTNIKYVTIISYPLFSNDIVCYCTASNASNSIFTFKSTINQIQWRETRCNVCKNILSYTPLNTNILKHNPRIYANMQGSIHQIEKLYNNLIKLQIYSTDNYYFLFKEKQSLQHKTIYNGKNETVLQFSKDVICPCMHKPNFIKQNHEIRDIYRFGEFTLFCMICKKSNGCGWYNVKC